MIHRGLVGTGLSLLSLLFLFFALLSTPVIQKNSLWTVKKNLPDNDGYNSTRYGLYGNCFFNSTSPSENKCHTTGFTDNGHLTSAYVFLRAMHPLGFGFSFLTSVTAIYACFVEGRRSVVAYRAAMVLSAFGSIIIFFAMVEDSLYYGETARAWKKYNSVTVTYGPGFSLVVIAFIATLTSFILFTIASEINNAQDTNETDNEPDNEPPVLQNQMYYAQGSYPQQNNFYPPALPTPNQSYPQPVQLAYSPPSQNNPYPQQELNYSPSSQNNPYAQQQLNYSPSSQNNPYPQQELNYSPSQNNPYPQQELPYSLPLQHHPYPQQS